MYFNDPTKLLTANEQEKHVFLDKEFRLRTRCKQQILQLSNFDLCFISYSIGLKALSASAIMFDQGMSTTIGSNFNKFPATQSTAALITNYALKLN